LLGVTDYVAAAAHGSYILYWEIKEQYIRKYLFFIRKSDFGDVLLASETNCMLTTGYI
jgi:hypothetical protein